MKFDGVTKLDLTCKLERLNYTQKQITEIIKVFENTLIIPTEFRACDHICEGDCGCHE